MLDGTVSLRREWPELAGAPYLSLLRETIAILRRLQKEQMSDIAWFGGVRSGTDDTKLVGLGANAIGHGVSVALALGGEIADGAMRFAPDRSDEERESAVLNILKANTSEASMMARCAGKTRLHNIEPENLRPSPAPPPPPRGFHLRERGLPDLGWSQARTEEARNETQEGNG